ncbi:MAG: GNAT family N-acetyltransferase [Sphingomonas sp.]|nr:GNAT family N-acetyltransferase [Sphingomonas sp.]
MALVEFVEVHPDSADAQQCLARYFAEIADRFEAGFDPAQSSAPTLDDFAPPSGTFLVVKLEGALVGCGGFKREGSGAAYIKRMWVAPEARGHGLGRRLLHELEDKARALGYCLVRLETEKTLTEAQQLYSSSGYIEVPRFNGELYAHHWFEKAIR